MKNSRLYVRVSSEEKTQIAIHAKEHDMTMAQYILRCALADESEEKEEDRQLILELQRIGRNLNQIARRINSGEPAGSFSASLSELIEKIDTMCESIMKDRAEWNAARQSYYRMFLACLQRELDLKQKIIQLNDTAQQKRQELQALQKQRRELESGHP